MAQANMKQSEEMIERVPLVAYEAAGARYARIIRGMVIGWTASVLVFAAAIVAVLIN